MDPNRDKIVNAKTLGGKSAAGRAIKFYVGAAEDADKLRGVEESSVDLLLAMSSVG